MNMFKIVCADIHLDTYVCIGIIKWNMAPFYHIHRSFRLDSPFPSDGTIIRHGADCKKCPFSGFPRKVNCRPSGTVAKIATLAVLTVKNPQKLNSKVSRSLLYRSSKHLSATRYLSV